MRERLTDTLLTLPDKLPGRPELVHARVVLARGGVVAAEGEQPEMPGILQGNDRHALE